MHLKKKKSKLALKLLFLNLLMLKLTAHLSLKDVLRTHIRNLITDKAMFLWVDCGKRRCLGSVFFVHGLFITVYRWREYSTSGWDLFPDSGYIYFCMCPAVLCTLRLLVWYTGFILKHQSTSFSFVLNPSSDF